VKLSPSVERASTVLLPADIAISHPPPGSGATDGSVHSSPENVRALPTTVKLRPSIESATHIARTFVDEGEPKPPR
jgi:hypothetical protein